MNNFLIFLLVLTVFSQMPFNIECYTLRRFGLSSGPKLSYGLRRGNKLRGKINKEIEKLEIEYQNRKSLQAEKVRRAAFRKYLLPQSGQTSISIMHDFYNRS
jgi:hypothetical protein